MSWKKKFVRNWGRLGMKFNRYALSDLATIKYGKNQKKVLSESGNIPIYGTGGLMGYATTALYDKPSVLIGRKGTIGKVKYVEHPFWTVDTLFYTIINTDIVLPKYLYYVMSLIDLNNYNEGTTIPSLRTETLNRLEFDIPSLVEQETILSCLNPIDKKSALNNAINNNLVPHPYKVRIAAKQRRQTPQTNGRLRTDGKVSGRGGNEETAEQFASLLAA